MKHTIHLDLNEELFKALKERCGTLLNPASEIQRVLVNDLMNRGILKHPVKIDGDTCYMFRKWKVEELATMLAEKEWQLGVYDGNYNKVREWAKKKARQGLFNQREIWDETSDICFNEFQQKHKKQTA